MAKNRLGLDVSAMITVPEDTFALMVQRSDLATVGGRIARPSEGVDLGTGVLWAPWNVGASSPDDMGAYFAWGEVTPKACYEMSTYRWASGGSFKKYNDTDNRQMLEAEDDAATANWGDGWRTPTAQEWNDLVTKCEWTLKDVGSWHGNRLPGYLVCKRSNQVENKVANPTASVTTLATPPVADSCCIFLPVSGLCTGEVVIARGRGCCWSAWRGSGFAGNAYSLGFDRYGQDPDFAQVRCVGLPVRAVRSSPA